MNIDTKITAQLAQFLALSDPRCGSVAHNQVIHGHQCQNCHRTLFDYHEILPRTWPA